MEQIGFHKAFALYAPESAELQRLVTSANVAEICIESASRTVTAKVFFPGYCPKALREALASGLTACYGLQKAVLYPVFAPEMLDREALRLELEELAEELPAVGYALRRCGFVLEEHRICLQVSPAVQMNLEALNCAQLLRDRLRDRFGKVYAVEYGAVPETEVPGEALADYADKVMREFAASAPAPRPMPAQPDKAKSPKREFVRKARAPKPTDIPEEDILLGNVFGEPSTPLREINGESGRGVFVEGEIFNLETREVRSGEMVVISADLKDKTGAVHVKRVMHKAGAEELLAGFRDGAYVRIHGDMEYDQFYRDYVLKCNDVYLWKPKIRPDNAPEKRVELHLHTNMSRMDGVSSPADLIRRAAKWGHKAIAITDHGVVQAYPEAHHAAEKAGIKLLYGMEAYFVRDADDITVVRGEQDGTLTDEYVCFDLETTGTDPRKEGITEIAAVVVRNGEIGETFHTYTDPGRPIPPFITELTGISQETVKGAPTQEEGVSQFLAFCKGRIVVAHNAAFDTGFIEAVSQSMGQPCSLTSIDTLELSRTLLPRLERHKLNYVAKGLDLPDFRHHSALADTETLARIFVAFLKMLAEKNITRVGEFNAKLSDIRRTLQNDGLGVTQLPPRHMILFAQNHTGLVNLNRLVSYGHVKYLNRRKQPLIPKHELDKYREGLLVGSACEAGELFRAMLDGADYQRLKKIAKYYDFLEIQPLGNNAFLTKSGYKISRNETKTFTREDLIRFNKTIVRLGEDLHLPVVATGDVHFLDQEDAIFRAIIMAAEGFTDADDQAPLYLRTTEEMLAEFDYLGPEKAYEVVVTNTNRIADSIEDMAPYPSKTFSPVLEGSAEELTALTWGQAHEQYGQELPERITELLNKELNGIISKGYDVMYMFAQKLIARSEENGYVVGSRGSVGSSLVAYFAGITEVNALPAHYRCPQCKYSEFHPECDCGPDMEDKACPNCGTLLLKDGYDIPFATFLGFNGDKEPDIDLNFSGEYQARAHRHTVELFGEENVFRAGTISTVAQQTAYGYVKHFHEERGIVASRAEEARLVSGCMGVKKTTGQHPGGLVVVPRDIEVYEVCPVCRPADKEDSDFITTHVDYHAIDKNLLKFDLLGKDDPTVLRYLENNTGIKLADVPLDDRGALDIFTSNEPLGIQGDEITGPNGALGIPEFGTGFVRGMLVDTKPTTIADLIRISGLSHGTDVWLGNAETLIREQGLKLSDCICCRDDIMNYLIKMGMDPSLSFKIMEAVRKGKKLTPDWEKAMTEHGIPQWYLDSCNKICYLFPKAHATAYVIMAIRIAWFKVYRPLEYYGSFFSIKAVTLNGAAMLAGDEAVLRRLGEIAQQPNGKLTQIDKEERRALEIAHEFFLRGFRFLPVDIYQSEPAYFQICREEKALRLPLRAIPGLGDIAANEIAEERKKAPFATISDFSRRCRRTSETITKELQKAGAFGHLPESEQISLFDFE